MNSRQTIESVAFRLSLSVEEVEMVYNAYWREIKKEMNAPSHQVIELKFLGVFVLTPRLLRSTIKILKNKILKATLKFEKNSVKHKTKPSNILQSLTDDLTILTNLQSKYYESNTRISENGIQRSKKNRQSD